MKRCLVAALIVIIAITSSGCWNRRELNELAVVMAIGIDKAKEDGKIQLTVQILKPAEVKAPAAMGEMGSPKGVWILTSTGYTVFDAFRNATMQSDRKLYLPHNKITVIGEEMARSGVAPLVDFLDRDHETRRLTWFLIAKGEASDILEAEHEQEKIPAEAIENLMKASNATSMSAVVKLHDFLKTLASKTTDPVASRIEVIAPEELKGEGEEGTEGQEGKPKKRVRLTGAAVFKEDKLVGWLNRHETRGLNWILGKVKSGIIVVKSPQDETKYISLEIIRARSKITPELKEGKVVITVEIEEEGNLGEQMSAVDLTKPEIFASLERRQAAVIKNEIESVLKKAQQEWGVDIFGFGEAVHRKFPREWQQLEKIWREEFPELEVKVKVIAKLRKVGLITTPAETK